MFSFHVFIYGHNFFTNGIAKLIIPKIQDINLINKYTKASLS